MINYTPFGHTDWQTIVADIKKFGSAGKKTAVVSTINGDANVPFYKELGNQGVKATDIPVVAFSVGEEELAGLDTTPLVGHLAAWNYFQSVDTPENAEFIAKWKAFIKNDKRVTNDPMEAHCHRLQHVGQGGREGRHHRPRRGDRRHDRRRRARTCRAAISAMMPNHHITKPVLIGEIQADGQFSTVWETPGPRRRRRVVGLSRGLEGPDLGLARADVVRELQRQDRQVRRPGQLTLQPTRPAGTGPASSPPRPAHARSSRHPRLTPARRRE